MFHMKHSMEVVVVTVAQRRLQVTQLCNGFHEWPQMDNKKEEEATLILDQ